MATDPLSELQRFMKDQAQQKKQNQDSGLGSLNLVIETADVNVKEFTANKETSLDGFDAIVKQCKEINISKDLNDESSSSIVFGSEQASHKITNHLYEPIDEDGDTFLMLLLVHGKDDALQQLIQNCPDVEKLNLQNCSGQTLLFCSVCLNNRDIVCSLIRKNVRFDLVDNDGQNIFHVCADNSYMHLLKDILQIGKDTGKINEMLDLLNKGNSQGYTPFYMAVSKQFREMCHFLASIQSVDVNKPDNRSSNSPLHEAVSSNHVNADFIEFLIGTCKADINQSNLQDITPLHIVASRDDLDTFKVFMNNSANTESFDIYGKTPLERAGQNIRSYYSELWKNT